MSVEAVKETHDFQAEVKQLLHLMIHSLYSNKEIFLRELISNAADAADKLRFEALKDESLYENDTESIIRVSYDEKERTITVSDNGIGMSHDEVVEHIGTIARSSTREFFSALTGDEANDSKLIGQFGVGFYSAFLVADRVTLVTRRAGAEPGEGVRWESTGEGSYSIEQVTKESRGTEVILHVQEGEDEYLSAFRLRNIIHKFSDHIPIPIRMNIENEEGVMEEETVNRASAMWTRSRNEITEEEYNEFYKHVAHDSEDPMAHVHTRVEGKLEYTSLLYIPNRAPFDLWDRDRQRGIRLYVRRVFILDDAKHLMPNYLRFVRGIVDTDDLPLNISREILQKNRSIDSIRTASAKKILNLLEEMAENDAEKYSRFWSEFGRVMKEGPGEDYANKERIARLLRFSTTRSEGEQQSVSLNEYVSRMQPGQDKIYYVTADSYDAASNSPHLEIFRKKDIEVLLMYERVDEWFMTALTEFDGKPFQSVAKGDLDLGDLEDSEEKAATERIAEESRELVERVRDALGERVKDVRVTGRLTESPACLVADSHDISGNLQRILKSVGQSTPDMKPILEINPQHPLVELLNAESDSGRFEALSGILYDQALLIEAGQIEDPATFVHRLNELMLRLSGSARDENGTGTG